ncbi:protein kinase domain-containing protein [Botrimarina hoheduenensis]|uniref:Serine/threonine-protein kinase PknB n=1 Tax=Botrimarina hoheduenensis TaxID=2528000 RepID=A0A5C5VZB7_9BACT|nr:protein kinase [Botrimarina hoheduenensis]TWT43437.1 Serine/threonine-protein kinase PknB [Botrimarina hoheduenensis]
MADFATFVFTDLVGSVDLKTRVPGDTAAQRDEAYVRLVLTPHRERIEAGLADAGGRVVSTAGDGHFLAFTDTAKAALWALSVQALHQTTPIEIGRAAQVRVRIGLHAGVPQRDPNDETNYIGRAVDYASRLADQASADQVLASRSVASLLEDAGLSDVRLHSHGRRSLRGIGEVELFEVLGKGGQPRSPRADAAPPDQRQWTVLPATMGLTDYHRGSTSGLSATTLPPQKRLGNYELGELIGAGGMGNVYKAKHTQFGRTRAIKLIKPELMGSGAGESAVRRFYQEVRATGALEHPNLVVAIDSSAPDDEQHYLVMEYIDGVGVDRLLAQHGRLDPGAACEIARQAALGLEHLASQGLVHRDVKPSNLMVTLRDDPTASTGTQAAKPPKTAVVKLMDLGLALLAGNDRERVTRIDHGGMGTGYYMSPEQWRTTSVDIRADIYSLGCTLYHLLTGEPPFAQSDLRAQKAHERESLVPASRSCDAPPELDALLRQMMAKSPEDRPQRPLEIAAALEPLADRGALARLVRISGSPEGSSAVSGDTRAPAQAALDTRRLTPRGSTLSKAAERAWWLAPTVVAIVTALLALNLAWWFSDLKGRMASMKSRMLTQHEDMLLKESRSAARLLGKEINERFVELEDLSKSDELRGWLRAINAAPQDESLWKAPQDWLSLQESEAKFETNSWFIQNRNGVQIARAPRGDTTGGNYGYRDYFHGKGYDFDPQQADYTLPEPITTATLSAVYRSDNSGKLKVAFSLPIFNGRQSSDAREVIGVLAMSVELGDFTLTKKEAQQTSDFDKVEILLVDSRADTVDAGGPGKAQRGLVLHHPRIGTAASPRRLDQQLLATMLEQKAPGGNRLIDEGYIEPFDNTANYWGAFAPVLRVVRDDPIDTQWIVIAQEPKPELDAELAE